MVRSADAAAADPARAREALAAVEDTGREALTGLRRALGVLRDGDARPALVPQPGLAHLQALVQRAGLPVALEIEGSADGLSPGVDLMAYRIVQDALSTAREERGARSAQVRVRFGRDAIEVEVRDDGLPPAGEDARHGLVALRERVRLYGGDVQAGRRRDGGHAVRARLPVGIAR
jgi:signal transduction histidine kinase